MYTITWVQAPKFEKKITTKYIIIKLVQNNDMKGSSVCLEPELGGSPWGLKAEALQG